VVIYVDSSVFLAWVFGEPRRPDEAFWRRPLVASRLLVHETWTRFDARPDLGMLRPEVERALGSVALVDMTPAIPARATQPFPLPVRTLDGLHLATAVHMLRLVPDLRLATYDKRMADAALALGIPLVSLE
jgi:predicted nucleic acid-binding protein